MRAVTDFETEMQIAQTNHSIDPELDTMFFTTSLQYAFLSSTIVKEVASYGTDISKYVPPVVVEAFKQKLEGKTRPFRQDKICDGDSSSIYTGSSTIL